MGLYIGKNVPLADLCDLELVDPLPHRFYFRPPLPESPWREVNPLTWAMLFAENCSGQYAVVEESKC